MSAHCLLKICRGIRHEQLSSTISIGRKQTVKRIIWPYAAVAGRSVAAKRHFHGSRKETSFCSMEAPGNCQELPYSRQEPPCCGGSGTPPTVSSRCSAVIRMVFRFMFLYYSCYMSFFALTSRTRHTQAGCGRCRRCGMFQRFPTITRA